MLNAIMKSIIEKLWYGQIYSPKLLDNMCTHPCQLFMLKIINICVRFLRSGS